MSGDEVSQTSLPLESIRDVVEVEVRSQERLIRQIEKLHATLNDVLDELDSKEQRIIELIEQNYTLKRVLSKSK